MKIVWILILLCELVWAMSTGRAAEEAGAGIRLPFAIRRPRHIIQIPYRKAAWRMRLRPERISYPML
ncbi:UNVERIFIED_CONTAM: hypothetical protein PYX00_006987 [Menopon gallinae]|uniref:Uncharacterized protein n=1 Tax=Menopon gallinae TaxID=328185 RepID=A0AAW2HHA8_9NEOP